MEPTLTATFHGCPNYKFVCAATQTISVDGSDYKRSAHGYSNDSKEDALSDAKKNLGGPWEGEDDLICECLNDSFTITYGQWECIGKCTKCGSQWTLYEG